MDRKITFKIKRFDGQNTWYQEYDFAYEKNKTVLWALIELREKQDGTLNFTSACRHAICGSCAVRVNGNAILACKTSLDEQLEIYGTEKLTIEPLNNYKVIRDLVIDWEDKFERMAEVKPFLNPNDSCNEKEGCRQSANDFMKISEPTDCILCGCCTSECTEKRLNDEFYPPFVFTKAWRFAADSREARVKEHIVPTLERGKLWSCVRCMQCVAKCPKDIRPAEHISHLREASMKLGYTNNLGARHAKAFFDDIKKDGKLNEVTLPLKTEGILKTVKRVPFALRMLAKGKLNPLEAITGVHTSAGIEQVRKIYRVVRKEDK